ncbi:MAG: hypothetical protein MPN21_17210 [Thermoanaerobaculia bacterium]|nr:hypothetical protein [Thermoanaerobaculia bacterium]
MDSTVIFGILATLLLLISAAYGMRRRLMGPTTRLGLGKTRTWLRIHLWCGGLFLLALGFHAGFDLPGGLLNKALWMLALWTVASGVLGLAVQRMVPRVLSASAAVEVNYERIPELVDEIRDRAESLSEEAEIPVRNLYRRSLAPILAAPQRNLAVLLDAGSRRRPLDPVDRLQTLLPEDQRHRLDELEALVRTKLDLDTHYTLQQVLRGWLWLHVPTSGLLIVLVGVHVVAMLYY